MGTVADKLTYLNNTKQGLKNVINYTGAGIDSNTTFRNYEEKLYNGYLDILKDNGETLFNNLPKVNGEGISVTLNNTANAPMKMSLGASELEQETTTGKNLLDGANSSYTNYANSTLNNEIIKISSTATNTIPFSGWVFENLQANDVIRYSAIIQNSNGQIVLQWSNDGSSWTSISSMTSKYTDGITSVTKTFTNTNGYSKFRVLLYSSNTIPTGASESSYKNVIVTVNNSDMTYEPYTNGASPNPDYPQEIHTISGDNEIKVGNLINLLDWDKFIDFSNWVNAKSDGYKMFKLNDVKGNTTYTLCRKDNTGYGKSIYVGFNARGNNTNIFISNTDTTKNLQYISETTTTNGDLYIVSSGISSQNDLNYLVNTIIKDAWVIEGSSFKQKAKQTLPLNLGNLEYCKIGDYEDEFVYNTTNTTLELNKWYLKKNIGKVTPNVVNINNSYTNLIYALVPKSSNAFNYGVWGTSPVKCNKAQYLETVSNFDTIDNLNKIITRADQVSYWVGLEKGITLSEAQSKLSNLLIYYILKTPTYTLLNDTLQTQLNNIRDKVLAYQDQTNISQVNNDLPFRLKLSAIKKYSE